MVGLPGGDNMKSVLRLMLFLTILEILKEYVEEEIIQFFDIRQNSIWEKLMNDGGAYLIIILLAWVLLKEEKLLKNLKESEERYYYLANHDYLTGLPNRMQFFERLEQALKENYIENDIAILLIDLDGFKKVNDSFGHEVGDMLLQAVAHRLKTCVQEKDTVSRLAGDEFTVLLSSTNYEATILVTETIIKTLQSPYIIYGNEIMVTPSIGIAFAESDVDKSEKLLKYADVAMYQAKKNGKNNYQIHTFASGN
jgi:diguanylate cyclase (GGDEF)-like protein